MYLGKFSTKFHHTTCGAIAQNGNVLLVEFGSGLRVKHSFNLLGFSKNVITVI